MRSIECEGCVHLIPKMRWCGLHRSSGRPIPIGEVDQCRDYAAPSPAVEACLAAVPRGLPASAGLDRDILVLFIRLVFAHEERPGPPFWFFSDPHYPDDEVAGRMDIVDYRAYDGVERILEALGYPFSRPAGPVRDLPLPGAERARFLREFGAYYALAISGVNRVRWERDQKRARRMSKPE